MKLTLINFNGKATFAYLPVSSDGKVRITPRQACTLVGEDPQEWDRNAENNFGVKIDQMGKPYVNTRCPKPRTPAISTP